MKRLNYILLAVLSFGIFLGFSVNDNPTNGARQYSNESSVSQEPVVTDNNNPSVVSGFPYYTDDFDGANDTTSLIGRGYEIYRRGGPPGVAAIWFQGNPTVFVAFNGPDSGYVASNFQSTTGANNIDNWLVLPPLNVVSGDSIFFRERSVAQNPFPDSMRVMYNPTGSSLPEDANWVELGRFLIQ
ncbi:MAG: choice-of-anchor J domain-containing protein [Ignavibacteria bacterium]|nr:choice-of-anchor J domain-containing protein [Ignavibacteria bacterium]